MSNSPQERPTLLVIDDAPESIDVLRGVLSAEYRVKACINGAAGLEVARSSRPDLILLDVMMPGMDGYEVCRRLKEDSATRAIPVIFVTTLSDVASESQGLAMGAADYVTKPYVPELVRSRVRTHIALSHQSIALERLVAERTAELLETRLEIVRRLGRAAEYRDNETGMHVVRMSRVSRLIALALGSSEADATLLLHAAPMHDIGKIGVPDRVLLKPGKLDADEWQLMRLHTIVGGEIIGQHSSDLMKTAREVALRHHERWDGRGYPDGIAGEAIPLSARIVALADVIDALLSNRPYKVAWSREATLDYVRAERGRHFDPKVVDAFMSVAPACFEIQDSLRDH
jgi:putative two-component system response regulator